MRRIRDLLAIHLAAPAPQPDLDPERAAADVLRQAENLYGQFQVEYDRAVADQLQAAQRGAAARAEAGRWEEYARQAVAQGRDDLARQALSQKHDAEARLPELERAAAQQAAAVEALRRTGDQLRSRVEALRAQKSDIAARHHAALAGKAAGEVARGLDPLALGGVMDRIDEQVLREQAQAGADLELAGRGAADHSAEVRDLARRKAIEDDLAAIKAKQQPPTP